MNFQLDREIDAARLLRASLADILGDDEEFAADVVEGETSIHEAIQAAVSLYCQDQCAVAAIEEHIKVMEARKSRLRRRMENTRTLVCTAMDVSGRKSVETALGTVTIKVTPRKLNIDAEKEGDIPLEFWKRGDPVLDKKKLKSALEAGEDVPGARLDNGGSTVEFRFR